MGRAFFGGRYTLIRSKPVIQAPIRSRPVMRETEAEDGRTRAFFMTATCFSCAFLQSKVRRGPTLKKDSRLPLVARLFFSICIVFKTLIIDNQHTALILTILLLAEISKKQTV